MSESNYLTPLGGYSEAGGRKLMEMSQDSKITSEFLRFQGRVFKHSPSVALEFYIQKPNTQFIGTAAQWEQVHSPVKNGQDAIQFLNHEPIGVYGLQWMHFMEKEYPEWVEVLRFEHRYLTEARKIDKNAWEYRLWLDEQYERENPRPNNFEDNLVWARTQQYLSDSTVMREIILVPPTVPTGETE